MSQTTAIPSTSAPASSNFQSILQGALEQYNHNTKNDLLADPLFAKVNSCESPAQILSVLQGIVGQFDQRRRSGEWLTKLLNPTVHVLHAFSGAIGGGVSLVFPPAKVISAAIGILLQAAKDVAASQGVLVDLFGRIENFFKRLGSYTEVRPTPLMEDIIVKIFVEVLSVLAIATKEIRRCGAIKHWRKLIGNSDLEDALKKLDVLTREEARMATAELLRVTRGVDDKVTAILDDGRGTKDLIHQTANEAKVIMQHAANDFKTAMQQTASETKAIMQKTTNQAKVIIHLTANQDEATLQQISSNVDGVRPKPTRQEIRKWLSPPDPSTNHNIACSARHRGTATWFFEGSIYKEWKTIPSLLWIYGKPGAGKTIFCSGVIQEIMELCKAESASIAYFYCDFRDEDKQTRRSLLVSVLFQLSAQSSHPSDTLSHLFWTHDEGNQSPCDASLIQCLKELLSQSTQYSVFLIVDAIDECPDNSGIPSSRDQVLDLVKDLFEMSLPNLHLCVTSRLESNIEAKLEPLTPRRVSLHDQSGQKKDIINYITFVVHSDGEMRRWRKEDKRLVIESLSKRANGMFRWVYCQLGELRHCLPLSVKGILDELPESLDETYERILRNINKANRGHAFRLLQCLTVALRPLRVEELAEVLKFDFDATRRGEVPKLNPKWRLADQQQAVLSTCSSLVAIVNRGGSQVVQFSHFSVKEFLISSRLAGSSGDISRYHILLEPAHQILAQACLGVLLSLGEDVGPKAAKRIPLAKYSAKHWVGHAQFGDVSLSISEAMQDFFNEDNPHWRVWLRVYNVDIRSRPPGDTVVPPGYPVPLYYAALCGFYDLAGRLVVKNPGHVNAKGGQKGTPLGAALLGKHFHVAELLRRHGADVNWRGSKNWTLLHLAAHTGNVDAVQWLLDRGAILNIKTFLGLGGIQTALHSAASQGHLQVCRMLLGRNADVNARNALGLTPLHVATTQCNRRNQLDVMKCLIEKGADVNARDKDRGTPLHHSSSWTKEGYLPSKGTIQGSRLLLKHGAVINAKDKQGRTPLQLASDARRNGMVEFLSGWKPDEHGLQ